jgi:hypothetical protein
MKEIKCDFELCIYQKDGHCSLDRITINDYCSCEECVIIKTEEEFFEKLKEEGKREEKN